jgi:hypothetical protein
LKTTAASDPPGDPLSELVGDTCDWWKTRRESKLSVDFTDTEGNDVDALQWDGIACRLLYR